MPWERERSQAPVFERRLACQLCSAGRQGGSEAGEGRWAGEKGGVIPPARFETRSAPEYVPVTIDTYHNDVKLHEVKFDGKIEEILMHCIVLSYFYYFLWQFDLVFCVQFF